MKWHEYWYGRQREEDYEMLIFKTIEYILQKNYNTPADFKIFLNSVKSKKMDHKNRNEDKCNVPPEEINSLRELV